VRAFFEDFLNGARKDNFVSQGRVLKFDFFSQMATDAWDLAEQIVKQETCGDKCEEVKEEEEEEEVHYFHYERA